MARTAPLSLAADSFERLGDDIAACRRCRRLVDWREQVAMEKRAAYRDETYWGRGVPGFGDPAAAVLVLGLAPAAHGANRTGRVFTGDRSGDWLFRALHRAGAANQPSSTAVGDGLDLSGVWVAAAVRCAPPANKPEPAERQACLPFLQRELALLGRLRAILVLGHFAYDVVRRDLAAPVGNPSVRGGSRFPKFGHGVEVDTVLGDGRPVVVVCSFHPSQQNTFTGKLTEPMFDAVLSRVLALSGVEDDVRGRTVTSDT